MEALEKNTSLNQPILVRASQLRSSRIAVKYATNFLQQCNNAEGPPDCTYHVRVHSQKWAVLLHACGTIMLHYRSVWCSQHSYNHVTGLAVQVCDNIYSYRTDTDMKSALLHRILTTCLHRKAIGINGYRRERKCSTSPKRWL